MSNEFSEQTSILKKARLDQGLSLEMVHEATKIPLDVLRAIEEGYKVRTLTPFYYKAFLRTYAKYLEVDPNEAVDQFKVQEEQKGVRLTKPKPKKEFVPPKSKLSKEVSKFWTPQRKSKAIKWSVTLVILFIVLKVVFFIGQQLVNWVQSWGEKEPVKVERVIESPQVSSEKKKDVVVQKSKAQSKSAVEQKKANKEKKKTAPTPPPPRPQPVKASSKTAAPSIGDGVTVTVRATRDAFLIVRADGRTVFQSSLAKGAVETWNANDKILLSGKNIGYLEFEVNGRMIGGLSRGDAKAKKVTITKNGLSVQK